MPSSERIGTVEQFASGKVPARIRLHSFPIQARDRQHSGAETALERHGNGLGTAWERQVRIPSGKNGPITARFRQHSGAARLTAGLYIYFSVLAGVLPELNRRK